MPTLWPARSRNPAAPAAGLDISPPAPLPDPWQDHHRRPTLVPPSCTTTTAIRLPRISSTSLPSHLVISAPLPLPSCPLHFARLSSSILFCCCLAQGPLLLQGNNHPWPCPRLDPSDLRPPVLLRTRLLHLPSVSEAQILIPLHSKIHLLPSLQRYDDDSTIPQLYCCHHLVLRTIAVNCPLSFQKYLPFSLFAPLNLSYTHSFLPGQFLENGNEGEPKKNITVGFRLVAQYPIQLDLPLFKTQFFGQEKKRKQRDSTAHRSLGRDSFMP